MERLMALYNISSPSGGEKRMARFITDELRRMGIAYRKDRHGNIYAVKGNRRKGFHHRCTPVAIQPGRSQRHPDDQRG